MKAKPILVKRSTRTRPFKAPRRLGCPFTRNRSVWCYGMCTPKEGIGVCGRVAHHTLRGRTQEAIANQQALEDEEVFDVTELEHPELWCRYGAW